jgi:hypothetical protein
MAVLLGVVGLAATGCAPGVKWRFDTYERVHAEAQAANQLTFVYFRNWYSVECTQFEENVLKRPDVLQATADLVCVPIDFDWDLPLADQWDIRRPPAFVIVDPEERILGRGEGEITREELLEAIRQAREQFAPMTQPTTAPP